MGIFALVSMDDEPVELIPVHEEDSLWEDYDLHIKYEGYHPTTGVRYCVVEEELQQCILANTIVIGYRQFLRRGFRKEENL